MDIAKNIKSRRLALGISQCDLAKEVGVTQAMICQIERGSKVPTLPLSKEIANVLKCKVDDLAV